MIAELGALTTALASLSYPVYVVWVPSPVPAQYVVLGGRGWESPDDLPLCSTSGTLDTDVRIKAVTGTPEGVFTMLARIRGVLSPNLTETTLPLTGRSVSIRFVRSEFVDVDTDTTITGTNRHPAFGVDTYHITSQPS